MAREKILVVEDEDDIQELVSYNLSKEGYQVTCVATGEEGLQSARAWQPNLIILDLMLPGIDGLEVCKVLKHQEPTRQIPVIMLTAKGEESDVVSGLELGADDYITKPFSPRILVARARTVLRRNAEQPVDESTIIRLHDIVVNPGRREVQVDGQLIDLTFTEFGLLHHLIKRPGWVFSRYQIVEAVRGDDYAVTERSVDVQIHGLRKKLGPAGKYVQTVRGVGYRFKG
ncbi:MAG TPA: response regulator [Armatimonadota bacterium]